ncbi:response regulator [Isoptericola sp. NPDC019693]|uniref:response regulator n=1 Tax=Isoptericola sp. NPDC019693 TaxID=3364009 RepID=UPI00379F57F6
MTVRVLVVDDQELIRGGFVALLRHADGVEVVGEAGDGDEGVRLARELRPDVVLMDLRMPGTDGLTATARIADDPDLAAVRVVVLTTFEGDAEVLGALRAGASGFLGKGVAPADLVAAVRTVAAGEALLSPAATRAVVAHLGGGPHAARGIDPGLVAHLTDREREVVALVGQGLSNDEIAAELVVSPFTAKTHVSRALAKTGARDRAQLVVIAYRSGLVEPR